MKVLIIGSRVPFPLRDGGAIATYNLLKGLSEQEIEVDFITLNTSKHFVDAIKFKEQFNFCHYAETFFIKTDINAFKALKNLFSEGSYNVERFTDSAFAIRIQQLCDANQYDIIHFEGLFVAQYLPLIKTKSVKILRQHNIEYSIWETLAATKKGLKAWYINFLAKRLEILEKHITKQFDALVSITEADRITSIQTLNFKKICATIPAGIVVKTPSDISIKSNQLYHIGSMEWMPNLEAMEWFHKDIWPIIAKASPEAEFFMAGKNMPSSYQTWNDNHFHVSGEVESVENFSADKGILVVPLRSGSGIRIKTIEAMMAGKAVVTTTQGAQGLDIIDGEHCLIADDAITFAEKTIMLIKDETLRLKLSENGKRYAESNFGNEAVSEIWLRFYRDILAMNHG